MIPRTTAPAAALALALALATGALPASAQPPLPAPTPAPAPARSVRSAAGSEDPPGPAVVIADEEPAQEQPVDAARKAPRKQLVMLGLGLRTAVVESKGYDPFSASDAMPLGTLFGTVTPWATRPFSVHLAFEWDFGSSSAQARGIRSSMDFHRLALGLELRYLPVSRIMLFARAMPGAIHVGGTVEDASFADHLEANAWTWGVDTTAGAAARVVAFGDSESPAASMWVGLDMGVRFAGDTALRLRPGGLSDDDQGRKFGEIPMADLDLSGFVGRLTVSVSF